VASNGLLQRAVRLHLFRLPSSSNASEHAPPSEFTRTVACAAGSFSGSGRCHTRCGPGITVSARHHIGIDIRSSGSSRIGVADGNNLVALVTEDSLAHALRRAGCSSTSRIPGSFLRFARTARPARPKDPPACERYSITFWEIPARFRSSTEVYGRAPMIFRAVDLPHPRQPLQLLLRAMV